MHNSCFVCNTRDGTDNDCVFNVLPVPTKTIVSRCHNILYYTSCHVVQGKPNKINIVYTIPMYTVLPSVLVPRYTAPSVATNYISKQVGNTYQKFNMHRTFQIMLNDIMSVYIYTCALCNSVKIVGIDQL